MAHFLSAGSDNSRKHLSSPDPYDYMKFREHTVDDFRTYFGRTKAAAVDFAVIL